MDIIVLILVIAIALIKAKNKKEKKQAQSQPNVPVRRQPNQQPQQTYQPNQQPRQTYQPNQAARQTYQPNQQPRQTYQPNQQPQRTPPTAEEQLKMRNLKTELQKKYKKAEKPQEAVKAYTAQKQENIVNRAADNVQENHVDVLRQEMEEARQEGYGTFLAGAGNDSELIRELEDLMVKGYEANLTFSRDFVAEGTELLNRWQLTEAPGNTE